MEFVIFDETYQRELPKSATDENFTEFVKNNAKGKLRINDECKVKIQFQSNDINLGNISSGIIKPIIDCLYPVLGGKIGAPDDHVIRLLVVQKGVNEIPQESVRIIVSKFSEF